MMWRVVRRGLALIIHATLGKPILSFVTLGIIVGAIGLFVAGFDVNRPMTAPVTAQSSSASKPLQQSPNGQAVSSPAVDAYLKGMTTFNANLMWQALSQQAIDDMTKQGGSVQSLQTRLDQAKQNGARYESVTYVGGYPLQNGEEYLFYVVSRRGFAGPNVFDQVYFVFTVGTDGKIMQIQ